MSWRDWFPNVRCYVCKDKFDYREGYVIPLDYDAALICNVCMVKARLEGKVA